MAEAMLFSQMRPPRGEEARFERWYDIDHIAKRLVLEGFRGAFRYWQLPPEGSTHHHLAIYELESLNAVATPEYLRLKVDPGEETEYFLGHVSDFTRFTMTRITDQGEENARGAFLSVVAFQVPGEDEEEFEDWYVDEHVPLLLQAGDWLRVHRYRVVDGVGGPWTHLALHELATAEVMRSPERARARNGPKRDALAERPWFGQSGRWLYRRAAAHQAKG
ncbi:hypothetical protein LWF01_16585 [Saxibacter everestensis]|uniref:DUF4286 family protein n=1 Tax=Saxibacter everestensis TaxID=2909229 RepID=A0ABY8QRR2_9MICO|nr:hypothetical protein LWF01_16585 [Brevibacteriaceae bacterium ZFBP1038]